MMGQSIAQGVYGHSEGTSALSAQGKGQMCFRWWFSISGMQHLTALHTRLEVCCNISCWQW